MTDVAGELGGRFRSRGLAGAFVSAYRAELLDALGLSRASVCGYSYGAWLARNDALHRPARVRRLALLDPTTCIAGPGLSDLAHTCPALARRAAARVRRVIEWETHRGRLDPSPTALACLGGGEYRRRVTVTPHPPAPPRLRAMAVPTLVVPAARSRVPDVARVHTAARGLLADATIRVLPGAHHHVVPITDARRRNPELAGFLADDAPRPHPSPRTSTPGHRPGGAHGRPPPTPGAPRDPGPTSLLPSRGPAAGDPRGGVGAGATVPARSPAPRPWAPSPGTSCSRHPFDAGHTTGSCR